MADRYEAEHTATVVERLATLLGGGVVPDQAWQKVAQAERFASQEHALTRRATRNHGSVAQRPNPTKRMRIPTQPRRYRFRRALPESTVARVARLVAAGSDAGLLLQQHPEATWRALGATWWLAAQTGAPLALSLRALAGSFRDLSQTARDVEVALAGPASASRVVLALPLVGIALGAALGFDTLGVLTGSALGFGLFLAGAMLAAIGWWWNRALVRRATKQPQTPGFGLDLVAMAMLSGRSAHSASKTVREVLQQWRLDDAGLQRLESVIRLATDAGVPAGELLRSEASLERAQARTTAARAAARLGVRLMLPLGVCILPAFLAVGVAPLVIAVLQRTLGS